MTYAYIRVSTDVQSFSGQKFEIVNWAEKNGVTIDRWESEAASGTLPENKRKLGKIIRKMKPDDLLICTEISRLGRNMLMIMSILNECSKRGIRIHTIKDNFDLSNEINSKIIAFAFALAAEIERNLISQRTKEALADKKAAGVVLGRPRGSFKNRDAVMRDRHLITKRLEKGETLVSIAKEYKISRNTLKNYLAGHGNIEL